MGTGCGLNDSAACGDRADVPDGETARRGVSGQSKLSSRNGVPEVIAPHISSSRGEVEGDVIWGKENRLDTYKHSSVTQGYRLRHGVETPRRAAVSQRRQRFGGPRTSIFYTRGACRLTGMYQGRRRALIHSMKSPQDYFRYCAEPGDHKGLVPVKDVMWAFNASHI